MGLALDPRVKTGPGKFKNIDFDVGGLALEGPRVQNKFRGSKSIDFDVGVLALEGPAG